MAANPHRIEQRGQAGFASSFPCVMNTKRLTSTCNCFTFQRDTWNVNMYVRVEKSVFPTRCKTFFAEQGIELSRVVVASLHRSQAVVLCLIPAAKHR